MNAITDTPKTTPEFREWFCHRIGHEFTGISIEECDFAACYQAGLAHARGEAGAARKLAAAQAEDEGLWFNARYASEAYLQRALRELHSAVEQAKGE